MQLVFDQKFMPAILGGYKCQSLRRDTRGRWEIGSFGEEFEVVDTDGNVHAKARVATVSEVKFVVIKRRGDIKVSMLDGSPLGAIPCYPFPSRTSDKIAQDNGFSGTKEMLDYFFKDGFDAFLGNEKRRVLALKQIEFELL